MQVHHKIAGIILRDGKMLMYRKPDEPHFIMAGGRAEPGESPGKTLERELSTKFGLTLRDMRYWNTYQAPHFRDKDKIVDMEVYLTVVEGEPHAKKEAGVAEIAWVDSHYKENGLQVASINEDNLIPELKRFGLIN